MSAEVDQCEEYSSMIQKIIAGEPDPNQGFTPILKFPYLLAKLIVETEHGCREYLGGNKPSMVDLGLEEEKSSLLVRRNSLGVTADPSVKSESSDADRMQLSDYAIIAADNFHAGPDQIMKFRKEHHSLTALPVYKHELSNVMESIKEAREFSDCIYGIVTWDGRVRHTLDPVRLSEVMSGKCDTLEYDDVPMEDDFEDDDPLEDTSSNSSS